MQSKNKTCTSFNVIAIEKKKIFQATAGSPQDLGWECTDAAGLGFLGFATLLLQQILVQALKAESLMLWKPAGCSGSPSTSL